MSELDQQAGVEFARAASAERASWLVSIHRGFLDINAFFVELHSSPQGPLYRIRLQELLRVSGRSVQESSRLLRQVIAVADPKNKRPIGRLTIAWLTDKRAGGRRAIALEDALAPRGLPWPGYPLAPEPNRDHA